MPDTCEHGLEPGVTCGSCAKKADDLRLGAYDVDLGVKNRQALGSGVDPNDLQDYIATPPPDALRLDFDRRDLRAEMAACNLTIAAAARQIGVGVRTLERNLKSNAMPYPTRYTLQALIAAHRPGREEH